MPHDNSPRKNALIRLVALGYTILIAVFVLPFLALFWILVGIYTLILAGVFNKGLHDSRVTDISNGLWLWLTTNAETAILPSGPTDAEIQITPNVWWSQ